MREAWRYVPDWVSGPFYNATTENYPQKTEICPEVLREASRMFSFTKDKPRKAF
jgi:hypothetical protein